MSKEKNTGKWYTRQLTFFCIIGAVALLDRLLKQIALANLEQPQSFFWIDFIIVYNTGVAFGLFSQLQWLMMIISGAIIFFGIVYFESFDHKFRVPLALILGGALGNLVDRFLYGAVIDFIAIPYFSVINFADICISLGVLIVLYHMLTEEFEKRVKKKR
ncbi:MAG: signal peptidase II [Candidatus Woesearchaeota archaeon]